ncbi:MAG: 2-phosphosulfolactate phosphatase [Bacteroidia bacterium]|nr:2-phosphosulfolactate phosphatase [Bacteroidia bacterium]
MNGNHSKPLIDVCFTPALFHLYDPKDSIVVVIDVLRATSSICIAFHHGVNSIIPVSEVEEAYEYKQKGYLVAVERQGSKVEGFDFGNSPYDFMNPQLKGKDVVLTTTNGTHAIQTAKNSFKVVIGSFLNLDMLCRWLSLQNRNVIALCAGWKNSFNLEDTLLAGALVFRLREHFAFSYGRDTCIAAEYLYLLARKDMYQFLKESSHRMRLEKLGIEKDIEFCLIPDTAPVIPVLHGISLVNDVVGINALSTS